MQRLELLNEPWRLSLQEVLKRLDVPPDRGLSAGEVSRRRKRYGLNRLREAAQKSAWVILANQFKSLIILLLAVASGLSFTFGDWLEAILLVPWAVGQGVKSAQG